MVLLDNLRCHVKRSAANGVVNLVLAFEFLGEAKVCDLNFKIYLVQVGLLEKEFLEIFIHTEELFGHCGKMNHNVLQLKIPVNDKHIKHVIKAANKLLHDLLDGSWFDVVASELHDIFEVTAVAVLHKDVVSGVCLDCFLQPDDILTVYIVLVLDFTND